MRSKGLILFTVPSYCPKSPDLFLALCDMFVVFIGRTDRFPKCQKSRSTFVNLLDSVENIFGSNLCLLDRNIRRKGSQARPCCKDYQISEQKYQHFLLHNPNPKCVTELI